MTDWLMRSGAGLLCGLVLGLLSAGVQAAEPEVVVLWPEGAPGAVGKEDVDRPELRIYLPAKEKANGTAVVICPGGGYRALATDHEGTQVARWMNERGGAGFVLKYRLGNRYQHPAPLQDVQRAIRYVRVNAEKLGIGKDRVGVMGFSAGGHLASTAATHFDDGQKDAKDAIDQQSSRPDFVILGYPVISLAESYSHGGSRKALLGDKPDEKLVDLLSNERQVTSETPPTFLFHTADDSGVPVENSLAFFAALRKAKVPAELHVFETGPHGVGLAPGSKALSQWTALLETWLRQGGWLTKEELKATKVSGTVQSQGKPLRWGQIMLIPENSGYPSGFAMIRSGKFSIPEIAAGTYRVKVWDQGGVEPLPTIENSERIDNGGVQLQLAPGGDNEVSLSFRRDVSKTP